jgi:hypothetical protein
MEYTPFLSLLCPWRLDGHKGGQLGLDSGAHPASYTVSPGGSFTGDENLSKL